ncbi:hypothetical protein [Halomonas sp. NO4]|uniref:hypothetical protein n=1 Tax=Halomonas sp. NO4 TaxID=2484813 RepID=UPI0013D0C5B6|nr:hypothetical protein [Halomonas sp. NO4]
MNRVRIGQGRKALMTRAALCSVLMMGVATIASYAEADENHRLRPGVEPGDVVILRRVEAVPAGQVDRHSGPIVSKVNARNGGLAERQNVLGIQAIALSDDRASGIRSSVQGPIGSLHSMLGTERAVSRGAMSNGSSVSRAVSGSVGGGNAGGSVGAVTSGISGTIGNALSPLTGQK